ncbi:MAG TPA: hypothetical protein VLL05_03830 [Terriglobales bacterium]|nr:hypothetical protein [Terriglobales bacterium]
MSLLGCKSENVFLGHESSRMRLHWKFAQWLALIGFAVPACTFIIADLTDYAPNHSLQIVSTIFCPATILGAYLFFDIDGHSLSGFVAFTFLALLNSFIYFVLGVLIGKLFRRSPTAPRAAA